MEINIYAQDLILDNKFKKIKDNSHTQTTINSLNF